MFTFLMVASSWISPTVGTHITGIATFYAEGLMESVADYRGIDTSKFIGGVALNPAGDIGRIVWVEIGDDIFGPFISVDCAQVNHYSERLRLNRVIEFPYAFAMQIGMRAPIEVTVWFVRPRYRYNVSIE